jgi:hypothetical protein
VPGGTVLRAQPIHRRPQTSRARTVKVRDLDNPHVSSERHRVCGHERLVDGDLNES